MNQNIDVLLEAAIHDWHNKWNLAAVESLYLLINPFQADPLAEYEADHFHCEEIPLEVDHRWLTGRSSPYLLCFRKADLNKPLFHQVLRLALEERLNIEPGQPSTRAFCAWLTTTHKQSDMPQKAKILGQYATAHTALGEKGFRFYDPRITAHLNTLLTPRQYAAIFGELGVNWYYMDNAGHLHQLPEAVSNALDAPEAQTSPPLTLDDAQTTAFVQLSQANHLEQLVACWGLDKQPDHQTLWQLVQAAHARQQQSDNAVFAFVYSALVHHPEFDQHPTIAAVLNTQDQFSAWYSNATEEMWQTIISQLNQQSSRGTHVDL
jgi:hypothetical protein